MKKAPQKEVRRSLAKIEIYDLCRLAELAETHLEERLQGSEKKSSRLYGGRTPLLCLCQGAAEHFVRPGYGVKDFDVWAFYGENPEGRMPRWTITSVDFDDPKFGRNPDDCKCKFPNRRVDIIAKSVPWTRGQAIRDCLLYWLCRKKAACSAKLLKLRPVIVISKVEEEV